MLRTWPGSPRDLRRKRFREPPARSCDLRRRNRRRHDQYGRWQRHAVHLPRPAGVRLLAGDGQRLQHRRARARVGRRSGWLPRRAGGPEPPDRSARQRIRRGGHRRRGAAADPARVGVQGDRAGVHRDRASSDRPATADLASSRAPPSPRPRKDWTADDARGLRNGRLRRLFRRGAGDHAARDPWARAGR